jgi:dTDP-4-dehydrorhamnose 3,5-epimerase
MEVKSTPIEGLLLIKPKIFPDNRGDFFESYTESSFLKEGISSRFVQDNQSRSRKNVLRGMHFQVAPFEQGKLVRVVTGSALDVATDIRKSSATYLKSFSVTLSGSNNLMLWIPPGFAHGFLSLEDDTVLLYKCTAAYTKDAEKGIRWNDPELNIDWGISNPVLSEKDSKLPLFKEYEAGLTETKIT